MKKQPPMMLQQSFSKQMYLTDHIFLDNNKTEIDTNYT